MIVAGIVAVVLLIVAVGSAVRALRAAESVRAARGVRPFSQTGTHYRSLMSRRSLLKLGVTTAGAFVLAHSGVDTAVEKWHTSRVRGPGSDAAAEAFKGFGERFWFFVWGGFALLDGFVGSSPVLQWGRRNFECLIVGLPALWTIQRVGGGGRPTDEHGDPRWRPMHDDNTASGHTFMAAIPWLNAGKSVESAWFGKIAWALSWGTGWSRLNDRKHYVSQVVLGHGIASGAVEATRSDAPSRTGMDVPGGEE